VGVSDGALTAADTFVLTVTAAPSGLVAAYGFNEGTGTTVSDASGNGITGAINGATWTTGGKYGSALSFNGSSSYVDLGNPAALQITGSITWSAWVKAAADPADDGQIVAKSDETSGWQFKTSPDTGPHTFGVAVSSGANTRAQRYSTAVRSLNAWYHVAGVYDAAARTLDIYVNGVLNDGTLRNTIPASQLNSAVNVNIGRRTGGYYFNGIIDELRIYNRALSATEVQADMNTPVGGSPAPLAPTISDIPGQLTTVNTATAAIPFTVNDADTPVNNLTLSASSANVTLVPNNNIVFGGSGAGRTMTVTPAANQTGTATITVTVSDGALTASDTFVLTVNAVNTPPTISSIAGQTISEDTSTGPISFTVGDAETAAGSLTLGKGSSSLVLVPSDNIVFGGSGANRTVTVTPASNQTGTATITVTVSDGQYAVTTNFLVTVNAVTGTGSIGPLVVSAANPRYFATPAGKTVLLGGSSHWLNLVDSGLVYPPPVFDYDAWLDFLSTNHHNFFRLWAQGLPKKDYTIQDAGPWYQSPQAWPRTGPGNATDGLPKFDLAQFSQAYFDRLRVRVEKAGARGMYVSVMLFDGYHVQFGRRFDDGYPLTGANNINGVDDGGGTRSQDFSVIPAAVLAAEEAYVRKVIDTVNDLPNVLYEIANEAGDYSTAWQQHFIAFIKNYEAGKAFQHPVGFTFQHNGGANSTLYSSSADWISPADDLMPLNDGTHHVVLNDTDHSYYWVDLKEDGPQAWRAFVWRNFTVGNSALFMDPYLMPWVKAGNVRNAPGGCESGPKCTVVDPFWNPIRQNIGYMLDYANGKLDLAKMTPQPDLASVGSCLASARATGAEYLVYALSGGSFTVNLSATTRPLAVEWLNPSTGAIISGGTVTGGASAQTFAAPFSGDAVLYLSDTAAHGALITDWGGALPSPLQITSLTFDAEGIVQVTVEGEIGLVYALEVSSDLVNWTKVSVEANKAGSIVFREQPSTNSIRFYRAKSMSK
jgi:hypothetical protein